MRNFPIAFIAAAVASLANGQGVLVVDGSNGPGADVQTVAAGVSTASPGDVLLIRSGTYDELVTIDGKGLVLQADAGAAVSVASLHITNVPANQFVAVRGLQVSGGGPAFFHSLAVDQCLGPVWLEDVRSSAPPATAFGLSALSITDCLSVVLDGCELLPGPLYNWGSSEPIGGLPMIRSSVYLFDSVITGVPGLDASFGCPSAGAPGIAAEDARVWLYGSTSTGGAGGASQDANFKDGEDGGPGVRTAGITTIVRLDSGVAGGAGGSESAAAGSTPGAEGPPFSGPGTVVDVAGSARSHEIGSPFRPGESLQATFLGESGEPVRLRLSTRPRPGLELGVVDGPLVIDFPLMKGFAQTLDPTGSLVLNTTAIDPAPAEALVAFAQAVHLASTGLVLGPPTLVVFLNGSF